MGKNEENEDAQDCHFLARILKNRGFEKSEDRGSLN